MKLLNAILILAVILIGCTEYKTSEELQEKAVVLDLIYIPKQHGQGSGVGITTGGEFAVTSNDITITSKCAMIFKCRHGKFIIEGDFDKYKKYWLMFEQGDTVRIIYKEIYEIADGKEVFIKYDFIEARPL